MRTFSSFANALSMSRIGPASRGSRRWNRPANESSWNSKSRALPSRCGELSMGRGGVGRG